MFDLAGRTALVTGATGGIGGGIAHALHAHGATVTISGTRIEMLDALAAVDAAYRTEPTDPHYRRALRELQAKREELSAIIAQRYDLASSRDES
jgi:3-oxoacyl-[acyl-carrier protein] reductase